MLQVRDVYKTFDGQSVLQGVSLSAQHGEIVALLGPSGCGKTTLLRIIAGLETADHGQLLLDGADLTQIPIHKRSFGMVFQDYALFPHKNVSQNVAFGLKMMGWKQGQIADRVIEVLKLVGLAEFAGREVHELSGGEQQRVALARALAPYPRMLLMDEPLGSLDRALRERLMSDLRSILKRAGEVHGPPPLDQPVESQPAGPADVGHSFAAESMTSIYVTHDQEEAFAIADRILVMNKGQIEQSGSPVNLFRYPETVFVARFLGMQNMLEAEVVGHDVPLVRCPIGELIIAEFGDRADAAATLLIRPDAASIVPQDGEDPNTVCGRLMDVSFRGRHQVAEIQFDSVQEPVRLKFNFESSVELPPLFSKLCLRLDPAQMSLLDP